MWRQGAARRGARENPRSQTEETVALESQALGLAWRLKVAWRLALAEWHRAAEQREDRFDGPAAGQKSKRLLEKAVLLENLLLLVQMRRQRHKSG